MVNASRDRSGTHYRGSGPLYLARQLSALADLIATVGAPCWAYGTTAAALHGFDGFRLEAPFHLVIPRGRSAYRVGHVIHRSRDVSRLDAVSVDGVPAMSATRTIIDLAAFESPGRLAVAIDSALRDRLTSEDFLHGRIVELRRSGRAGLGALVEVLEGNEVTRGGHSWLERRFLVLLRDAGLPAPETQQVVGHRNGRLIRVDCRFPGTNVVVELLGYRFHRSPIQLQDDATRMNRMILDGFRPLQFTYTDVATPSPTLLSDVIEALGTSGFARNPT